METDGDRVGSSAGGGNGQQGHGAGSKPVRKGLEQPGRSPDLAHVQEILSSLATQRGIVLIRESEARRLVRYVRLLELRARGRRRGGRRAGDGQRRWGRQL